MNIVEFARRAGVSTATVSRAFHEPDKLREVTRRKVLRLAEELDYYPDSSGRALVRGRHDVLGLIWPLEVEGPEALFGQQILAALTASLVESDLDLLICPVDRGRPETLAHARKTVRRSRCDAWILLYPRYNDALQEILGLSPKPVVCFLGRGLPEWKWVCLDQRSWMEEALRRLKASGCRQVAFFGCRPAEPDQEERMVAFRELAPKYFGKRTETLPHWPPDGRQLQAFLQAGGDGIIGVDDRAALEALAACRAQGRAVPGAVRVVGIDDSPAAALASLSSFRQPLDRMIACAVELALGRRKQSGRFHAHFVGRESLA